MADLEAKLTIKVVDYEQMVLEFMEKHGQHRGASIRATEAGVSSDIPPEVVVLRLRLMMEELGELSSAMHQNDLVLISDGLADLLYVVVGTAIAYGIPINDVFREVHRSNMTKAPLNQHSKGGKVSKEGYEPPQILSILLGNSNPGEYDGPGSGS